MGIAHLTATLGPYAVRRRLQDESIVIDGPALAYHILHVCRVNGIGQPSDRLVCQSTTAWLDHLSSHRVVVQAIYFDGHLPSWKREVRMKRLMTSTAQLAKLFSVNPQGCPKNQLAFHGQDSPVDVFKTGTPASKPFVDPSIFVPAVIDALRQSPRYRKQTLLVPGEADVYCARHVLQRGGLVLTSDSDLLAYSLGRGHVGFFRDVYRDTDSAILYSSFAPDQICRRLGLPPSAGPLRLAYERKRSPHSTLVQIVHACSKPVISQPEYQEFREQYCSHDGHGLLAINDESLSRLHGLDPRTSELIVQLSNFPDTANEKHGDAIISLPVLIENPARGSAWEQSTPVRQLAYTLLLLGSPGQHTSVHEYRRVQSTMQKGRQVEAIPAAEAQHFIDEILALMKGIEEITSGAKRSSYWPLFCLALDICECQKQGKESHIWDTFQKRHTLSIANASKISWDFVHFLAQLQAAFYSLRILSQVLSIVLENSAELVPSNAKLLRIALLEFPSLVEFPDIDSTLELVVSSGQNGLVRALGDLLCLPVPPAPKTCDGSKIDKDVKKRASRKSQSDGSHELASRSDLVTANMFSLLSAD